MRKSKAPFSLYILLQHWDTVKGALIMAGFEELCDQIPNTCFGFEANKVTTESLNCKLQNKFLNFFSLHEALVLQS